MDLGKIECENVDWIHLVHDRAQSILFIYLSDYLYLYS
jgi:hypothetical protein